MFSHTDPLISVLVFVALPLIAIILLFLVLMLALRGGRPVSFKAAGFGVSVDFSSNDEPDDQEPNKELDHAE